MREPEKTAVSMLPMYKVAILPHSQLNGMSFVIYTAFYPCHVTGVPKEC